MKKIKLINNVSHILVCVAVMIVNVYLLRNMDVVIDSQYSLAINGIVIVKTMLCIALLVEIIYISRLIRDVLNDVVKRYE
mgnify:FL=1